MEDYNVTIKATVIKTIRVGAASSAEATELAHQLFTVASQDGDEKYDEETLLCEKANK